nr:AAA family ATPase [Rhodothermus marinus]
MPAPSALRTGDPLEALHEAYVRLRREIGKVIVGQEAIIEQLVVCLLARGHALLIGVPGLAKTLLVRTLAQALDLKFSRIQFTPDLMPSDITGTEILEEDRTTGQRVFRFVKGPIFAHIVLADEINRTPPKTQAALLEAMQEQHVTASGQTFPLEPPFFVLATQNPIEQEGTIPCPKPSSTASCSTCGSTTPLLRKRWRWCAIRPQARRRPSSPSSAAKSCWPFRT